MKKASAEAFFVGGGCLVSSNFGQKKTAFKPLFFFNY